MMQKNLAINFATHGDIKLIGTYEKSVNLRRDRVKL